MDMNQQIVDAAAAASVSASELAEAMQQVANAMAQLGAKVILEAEFRAQQQELPDWV